MTSRTNNTEPDHPDSDYTISTLGVSSFIVPNLSVTFSHIKTDDESYNSIGLSYGLSPIPITYEHAKGQILGNGDPDTFLPGLSAYIEAGGFHSAPVLPGPGGAVVVSQPFRRLIEFASGVPFQQVIDGNVATHAGLYNAQAGLGLSLTFPSGDELPTIGTSNSPALSGLSIDQHNRVPRFPHYEPIFPLMPYDESPIVFNTGNSQSRWATEALQDMGFNIPHSAFTEGYNIRVDESALEAFPPSLRDQFENYRRDGNSPLGIGSVDYLMRWQHPNTNFTTMDPSLEGRRPVPFSFDPRIPGPLSLLPPEPLASIERNDVTSRVPLSSEEAEAIRNNDSARWERQGQTYAQEQLAELNRTPLSERTTEWYRDFAGYLSMSSGNVFKPEDIPGYIRQHDSERWQAYGESIQGSGGPNNIMAGIEEAREAWLWDQRSMERAVITFGDSTEVAREELATVPDAVQAMNEAFSRTEALFLGRQAGGGRRGGGDRGGGRGDSESSHDNSGDERDSSMQLHEVQANTVSESEYQGTQSAIYATQPAAKGYTPHAGPGEDFAMQHGGRSPGGLTLVGEAGPELLHLSTGAEVTSAPMTRALLRNVGDMGAPSAGTINNNSLHINVSGVNDVQSFVRELRRELRAQGLDFSEVR